MAATSYFPCAYRGQQRVALGCFGLTPEIRLSKSNPRDNESLWAELGAVSTCSVASYGGLYHNQLHFCLLGKQSLLKMLNSQKNQVMGVTGQAQCVNRHLFFALLFACLCFCNLCLIALSSKLFPCCILRG